MFGRHGSSHFTLNLRCEFRVFCSELFKIFCHRFVTSFAVGFCRRIIIYIRLACGCNRNGLGRGHTTRQVILLPSDKESFSVGACRDFKRLCVLQQFVCKAFFYGFLACHICRFRHHMRDNRVRELAFSAVNGNLCFVPRIVLVCDVAELVGIVASEQSAPSLVDHNKA